jgi:hypothetical protein
MSRLPDISRKEELFNRSTSSLLTFYNRPPNSCISSMIREPWGRAVCSVIKPPGRTPNMPKSVYPTGRVVSDSTFQFALFLERFMKKFHSNTARIENMPIGGDNLSQKEKDFLKSRSEPANHL